MKAGVICFSTSKTLDFLLDKLDRQGFLLSECRVIPQKREPLDSSFDYLTKKCDILFFVGGLGWKESDILKEFLVDKQNVNSVYTKKTQEYFVQYANITGRSLPPAFAQEKLLSWPEGFEVFPNIYGFEMIALGRQGGCEIILLPDNFEEVSHAFETYLKPHFETVFKNHPQVHSFKTFGIKDDMIESRLKELSKHCSNLTYTIKSDEGLDACVTVKFPAGTRQAVIDKTLPALYNNFAAEMYCDGDMSLAEVALYFLQIHKRKLALAESITGGMISSEIVALDGASTVLQESCVTYSNESKQARLLVSAHTLTSKGAVSSESAYEMAVGLLNSARCDTVLSITGIAGPKGGNASKPVGRTYIAVGDNRGIHVYEYTFQGSRNQIRKTAANTALFLLIKFLKKIR